MPPLPGLLRLLAHAGVQTTSVRRYEELMLALFGVAADPSGDPPIAAITRLGEGAAAEDGYWLRADPIHLYADQARLLLFAPETLAIQLHEAQHLGAAINSWYDAAGWRLEIPHPQRWYLRLPNSPGIRTHSLADVMGHDIDAFLPYGKNGKRWHGVLNEIQMLLHASPVNIERETQGLAVINSVWFWGGGELPRNVSADFTQVWSNEPLAVGLAKVASIASTAPSTFLAVDVTNRNESILIALPALLPALDDQARHSALATLERDWFQPALTALKANRLAELIIYPCDGHAYAITRARLRRFWQRRKTFRNYVQADRSNE
ncbi:MAG: hypothetical protein ACYDC8_05885 [Gammaproteobacteria bacterium]